MFNFLQQALPVADWVEGFTDWLTGTFAGLFSALQHAGQFLICLLYTSDAADE